MVQQHVEIAHVEHRGVRGPGTFDAAGDRIAAHALATGVGPAEALRLDIGAFGISAELRRIAIAMRLAHRVPTGGERSGFFVIHRHAGEGFAHGRRRFQRIRLAIDPFGIDIDQPHLDRRQRVFERSFVTCLGITVLGQPILLGAPVDVLFGMPDILAPEGEAKGFQAHGFIGDIARQDHQIGPADAVAVFLLDRPQQAPGLVKADIVGPGVERGKALVAGAATAAPVSEAIGTRRVPGHAHHQPAVMAPVGRPPVLAVCHQCGQILLERGDVELLQFLAIVEVRPQRVGLRIMLMEDVEVECFGPPAQVGLAAFGDAAVHHGAFSGGVHGVVSFRL